MTRQLAKGSRSHHKGVFSRNQTRVIVGFDNAQFQEIRDRAEKSKVSFGEQVRLLCEWGLEEMEQK